MKDVWILNHYAAEPNGVGGTRHFHLAEGMARHGWRASIIASSIELNSGRQRLRQGEKKRLDAFGQVPFLWVRVPGHTGNGGGRLLNMLAYSIRVLLPSYTHGLARPDAVVGSSVHPFAALSGALLALRFRVPFVFEVRDLWPRTLIDLGRIKENSFTAKWMRWLEKWLYRRAAHIVVLLPKAADYIVPLGIAREKITWIPNGVDLQYFQKDCGKVPGSRIDMMYFGAHGQANALDPLIDAMAIVKQRHADSSIRLRLIGNGDGKKALKARAESLGLDESSVVFENPVPKREIPGLAAEADAFVIHIPDRPELYQYGISPNKLFDYMAAGRPLVMACADNIDFTREYGCGIWASPDNPTALADAFEMIASMAPEARRELGVHARSAVEENFGFDQLSKAFATVLDNCVKSVGNKA